MIKPHKTLSTRKAYERHKRKAYDKLYSEIKANVEKIRTEFETSTGKKINCAEMHRQLVRLYPFAEMLYSPDHVMTIIHGQVWDKRGMQFQISTGLLIDDNLRKSFNWPVHNGDLDGTDSD